MEHGQLDCVIGAVSWLDSLSLAEVVDSVVQLPMGGFQGGSLFNISQQVWETVDDKTKNIMQDAALRALASTVYAYTAEEKSARENARSAGIHLVKVPQAMRDKRDAFMKSQIEQSAKVARGRGVKDPDVIVQAFLDNLDEWRRRIEGKNLSESEYYELLKQHVLADAGK